MVEYLLDTNICIYIAKKKPMQVLERFEKQAVGSVGMSVITHGELFFGAQKSQNSQQSFELLKQLGRLILPIPLSVQVGDIYGNLRHHLEKRGAPIGNNDLWIAAHALELGVVLVTNNQKEFSRVPHLVVENWALDE